jgi:predicted AAA+ superfamily ATPase
MRPMSLWESGEANGAVSLGELFTHTGKVAATAHLNINDIAYLVCRGGWPRATLQNKTVSLGRAYDYYDAVVNMDIRRVDEVARNPERVKLLMRSYARSQGTQTSFTAICADMKNNDNSTLDDRTIYAYINALKKIFVIEDMAAWNPNLRSKTAIRTSDTRYFIDPSIAVAALGLGPDDLIADLNTFGLLFECLCIRDLRIFADALGGSVYHYRDKDGLECDAVVHLRNGSYGLIEIKLGGDRLVEEGAGTLTTLAKKIDTGKMKAPSFLMVLTGTGQYAFRRADGVFVVPIGCLKD